MKAATHYSQDTDSFQAGRQAAARVISDLGGRLPELILLFSSIGHDLQGVLDGVTEVMGNSVPLCGCSGSGVISDAGCDEATHSLALMGIAKSGLGATPFFFSGLDDDPEGIGIRIGEQAKKCVVQPEERALLLLFTDGLTINADRLFRGVNRGFGGHIDIVGGTAGNDFAQNHTYQFAGDRVLSNGVSGVVLHGNFRYRIGVCHGSRPFGLFRTITRASGNMIYEIDKVPASEVLRKLTGGERVDDLGRVLNIFEIGEEFSGQNYSQDTLNRAIIGVDEESGGIRLAVEIAEGSRVRITRREKELVLTRTRAMTEQMIGELHDWRSAAYLYVNCCGRASYLFGAPEPDVDIVREVLTPESRMVGFFSFGEFAPIHKRNYFHNYTGVLLGVE